MCGSWIRLFFFLVSDFQIVYELVKKSQESHSRHLWQVSINTSSSAEESVKLGKTFNLSSQFSSLITNNRNYLRMRPKEFNVYQDMLFPNVPEEMCAGEKPEDCNVVGKALRYCEHLR
jgi:hypothetical protein